MSVFDSSVKRIGDFLGMTSIGRKTATNSLSVVLASDHATLPIDAMPDSKGSKAATDSLGVVLSTDTGKCTYVMGLAAITDTDTETTVDLTSITGAPHRAMRIRCRSNNEIRMAFVTGKVAAALYAGAIVIPAGSEWTLPAGVVNKEYNTLYLASVVVPVFVEIELWVSPTGV